MGPGPPGNLQTFLTSIDGTRLPLQVVPLTFVAQEQIATFFESDGAVTVDPDGPSPTGPLFAVPIAGPVSEI